MTTTLKFRPGINLPQWRPNAPALAAQAAGMCWASDLRNDTTNLPYNYLLRSATALDRYDPTTDEHMPLASPALTGTFGAGACCVFHPTQGPRGTLAAGATVSKVILTTALPAAVAPNLLANRGDGVGLRIRIIGNAAGSSGKIEERTIIANTGGTTPTIWLDSPLSFTPISGDAYEFLSGKVYMLSAGTTAAGCWKWYDVATNSYSGNLSITNLPATIGTDSCAIALSELYVPNDKTPSGGYFGNITSGAAPTSTTVTGSALPANLVANEYQGFQIRIVQDTTTPTAVGQRRRITSHTAGAAGVFTTAAWTVTPSVAAIFVVENDDDKILLRTSAATSTFTYNITANTWDTTTYGASGTAVGAGCMLVLPFGVTRDTTNNFRHSKILCFRGGASAAIDELDIANGATGTWTSAIVYGGQSQTFTTGTCGIYNSVTLGGRFLHINLNGTQRNLRFDCRNRKLDPETYLRFPVGTALVGGRSSIFFFFDGAAKQAFIYNFGPSTAYMFSLGIQQ
jgi:hypothetical protein